MPATRAASWPGELKRRHGWRLHITKRRQRAFKVVSLTWIVERTFAWLSQKSSLEQRLRVEGPNFGSLHRPGGHPPHAQTARPEVKLLKHPLRRAAAGLGAIA